MAATQNIPNFPSRREHGYDPPAVEPRLRRQCPVSKVKLFDGSEVWAVMKHKDICEALESLHLSADRRAPGYPEIHSGGSRSKDARPMFVNLDDPAHKQQREMLEDAFTPQAAESYKPMMQDVVNKVLDKMIQEGCDKPVDLIEKFATPIPTQIIYSILGISIEDVESLSKDSEIRTSTSRNAAETSNRNLQNYVSSLCNKRIEKPEKDLISKLVVEQYKPGNIEREDVSTLAFLVLTAGNAALINTIGLGTLTLLRHPVQLEELKKDPSLVPQAVNEILRFHTVSGLNSRRAVKEDTAMKKGEGVICAVQSGDRDEVISPHPDNFDIHRKRDPDLILGFGYGPHRCQAEHVSRAQLEIVFGTLFQRLPGLRLAKDPDELEYSPPEQNVGVKELPVVW